MSRRKEARILRVTLHKLRGILFFSVVISLGYGLLKLAGPLFMILVFDRVLPARSTETLIALLLLLLTTIGVMALLDYSRRRIMARFAAQFQELVEQHIFSSQARVSYISAAGKKPAAGLNELDQLRGFFHSGSVITTLDFLWSPVFLGVVFIIDPLIGWVVVIGLAVLGLINLAKELTQTERFERSREASERVTKLKDTLLVSRSVIQAQQMTGAYNHRWISARRQSRDAAIELKDWTAWFSISASHTALVVQYLALAAGAYQTISGDITIGAMVASMYLARHVVNRAERFLAELPDIREASRNWRTLDKILSPAGLPVGAPEDGSAIVLTQVTVRCPVTKKALLRNVSAAFAAGSAVEIVGGSGSGKTVLAETLIGCMPRASGKVMIGGLDIDCLSIADAARTIGYIPQRIDFISGTIEENILGLDSATDAQRMVHVARIAGIHHRIVSLPEGYKTPIDTTGSIFSKGERHQLALARALYPSPQILIVDEPDTSFRHALTSELQHSMRDFLGAGGILLLLTRVPLKSHRAAHRFSIEAGVLKEIKADEIRPIQLDRRSDTRIARPALTLT